MSTATLKKASSASVDADTVKKFKESIRGVLITPQDPSYDEERSVYNGMIDKYPALIVKCPDIADVIKPAT